MGLKFLNAWTELKEEEDLLTRGSYMSVFTNEDLLEPCSLVYVLSMVGFLLQKQSRMVTT